MDELICSECGSTHRVKQCKNRELCSECIIWYDFEEEFEEEYF